MKRLSTISLMLLCLSIKSWAIVQQSNDSTLLTPPYQLLPFKAKYTAFRSGNDIGEAKLLLESKQDNRYKLTYHSSVSRFFLSDKRTEITEFLAQDNNFIPLQYQYERTGTGPNKELSVTFDRAAEKIIVNNDEESFFKWNGELDNQLFRIDLPQRLALGETKVSYDFINYRGEKRHYELEVVATDNLQLPYGQITAIKVKINRESSSRVTFAWFAPSLNHYLVRLQQFKDGKEQGDMQLKSFTYL